MVKVVNVFKKSNPKTKTIWKKAWLKALEKKKKKIKDRAIKDIRNLLEQSNDCWKPIRVGNFWNNKYWIWK